MSPVYSQRLQLTKHTPRLRVTTRNHVQLNSQTPKAIIVFTKSGTTVIRASNGRPNVPIIAVTTEAKAARSLTLAWGVYPQVGFRSFTRQNSNFSNAIRNGAMSK